MAITMRTTFALALLATFALACGGGDSTSDDGRNTPAPSSGGSGSAVAGTTGSDSSGASGSDTATGGDSGDNPFGNDPVQPPSGGSTAPPMAQPGLDDKTCARADLFIERQMPRIVFLVDASSSMIEDFGGVSRWDALREALLADDGLVPTLQDIVKFGLITFEGPRFTTCPSYRFAAPAPGNLQYVDSAFPDAPPTDSSTPTGTSMDWAIDHAFLDQTASPDADWEPQFMIFATDGEPNGCAKGTSDEPARDFDSVLAAAHKAASRSIKIFVISLAEATGEFADHLAEVASIGETDKVYSPQNKTDLVSELQTIIGSAISCEVEITAGSVKEGMECSGEVTLNGDPLECNGDDGWELTDPKHILLKGQTCDDFKLSASALIGAKFPCEALE